jgi:hypothetical protein
MKIKILDDCELAQIFKGKYVGEIFEAVAQGGSYLITIDGHPQWTSNLCTVVIENELSELPITINGREYSYLELSEIIEKAAKFDKFISSIQSIL